MATAMETNTPASAFDSLAGVFTSQDFREVEYLARTVDALTPALPSIVDVQAVAHAFECSTVRPQMPRNWAVDTGRWEDTVPRFQLEISPGTVQVCRRESWALQDVAHEWEEQEAQDDEIVLFDADGEEVQPVAGGLRQMITQWSRASRARMAKTIAQLDMAEWMDEADQLAMVTFTMPGDWETCAPSGREFKKIMERFRSRWERRLGPLRGIWKMEFQERGAPHLHMLMRLPLTVDGKPVGYWLASQWVAACDHPDEVEKAKQWRAHAPSAQRPTGCVDVVDQWSDHRRIASYFNKHAAKTEDGKEYQHTVPEQWQNVDENGYPAILGYGRGNGGPGRFWGYWGLSKAVAVIDVTERDYFRIRRALRGVAQGRNAAVQLRRLEHANVPIAKAKVSRLHATNRERMKVRRRLARSRRRALRSGRPEPEVTMPSIARGSLGGMWVLVNDALDMVLALSRP